MNTVARSALSAPGAVLALLLYAPAAPAAAGDAGCRACHPLAGTQFALTAMAHAAESPDFLGELVAADNPGRCLDCHAPGGGSGLACTDCHGGDGHPFPAVAVPRGCGRCHDAPGESTVRRYLAGPAPSRGEDCLDCHLEGERTGHDFRGPSRPGFLTGVARLRMLVRRESGGPVAVIQVRHRAGHALPGGTTGRAVWLRVAGLKGDGRIAWSEQVRFGWEHLPDGRWREATIPPGGGVMLEFPRPQRGGSVRLRAELVYRFRPGPLETADPRQVLLDRLELALVEQHTE